MSCCEGGHGAADAPESVGSATSDIEKKFQEFMKAAVSPGALDARTKRAVAIALSVLAKCDPCAKKHIKAAREMGFTQDQIDEAAWMAVSFGGCPTMMFYKGVKRAD